MTTPTLKQLAARQAARNLNANNMRQLANSNFPFKYNLMKQSPYAKVSREAAAIGRANARIQQHLNNLAMMQKNYLGFMKTLPQYPHPWLRHPWVRPSNLTETQKRKLLEVGIRLAQSGLLKNNDRRNIMNSLYKITIAQNNFWTKVPSINNISFPKSPNSRLLKSERARLNTMNRARQRSQRGGLSRLMNVLLRRR